jgi:hypothetical protein
MQRILLTISHVTIAAISTYQIESLDMDLVITPAQAQIHWHCELNKKHSRLKVRKILLDQFLPRQ